MLTSWYVQSQAGGAIRDPGPDQGDVLVRKRRVIRHPLDLPRQHDVEQRGIGIRRDHDAGQGLLGRRDRVERVALGPRERGVAVVLPAARLEDGLRDVLERRGPVIVGLGACRKGDGPYTNKAMHGAHDTLALGELRITCGHLFRIGPDGDVEYSTPPRSCDECYFVDLARARRNVDPAPLLESRATRAAVAARRTRRDRGGGGGTTRYAIASRISLRMTRRTPDQDASILQTLL